MTDDERVERLTKILCGTGATVDEPFGIWALDCELTDGHIAQLDGWADLGFLMLASTAITDRSLPTICSFRNLTSLCIAGTATSAAAIAECDLPDPIFNLGLASIALDKEAVKSICRCTNLMTLNANYCGLDAESLELLSCSSDLMVFESLGSVITPPMCKTLSSRHPDVTYRLSEGIWKGGKRLRRPLRSEMR